MSAHFFLVVDADNGDLLGHGEAQGPAGFQDMPPRGSSHIMIPLGCAAAK